MKTLIALPLVLFLSAQKPVKKPDVHPDFYFGAYPYSRAAETIFQDDLARQIVVAIAQGWSIDKIAKNLKVSASDVTRVSDRLEDDRLVGRRDEFDAAALIPVIRDRDIERFRDPLKRHTEDFTKLIVENWKEIEVMVESLAGMKDAPRGRAMYETVVSGIFLGGMIDAFYEDKTMMPPPGRRGGTEAYYGWLVESDSALAGKLRRELRESAGYRVVSIGTALPEDRLNPDELRGSDTILEDADARKYRAFIAVFTRDKILPFFKTRRPEMLKLGAALSSGRNVAFAQFFAWYYNAMANGAADALAAQGRITPPEKFYTYAVKAPSQ